MRFLRPASLLLIAACCALSACFTDKAELLYPAGSCDTSTVTYSGKVKGILEQNCAFSGCHNTASAMSGVTLDNVTGAQAVAKDGRLLGTINHASGYSPMPKNANKLDDCTIHQISVWVAAGAPNN